MSTDPEVVWRFASWLAAGQSGTARLAWDEGEVVLGLRQGQIVSVAGLDAGVLAERLDTEPVGFADLLEEAKALAERQAIPDARAIGAAKRCVAAVLKSWLRSPERQLETVDRLRSTELAGPTISFAHTAVELVLSEEGDGLTGILLPDGDVVLSRGRGFLDRYASLQLSEEADLIVAKITGKRTVAEIASRSPQATDEVYRLLAALVAAGLVEPSREEPPIEVERTAASTPAPIAAERRRLPVLWIATALVVVVVALVAIGFLLSGEPDAPPAPEVAGETEASWGVAVDMGCSPPDLQRILKKQSRFPDDLRAVRTTVDDEACWRLVWGSFASEEEAAAAATDVPDSYVEEGFDPHPVEVDLADVGGGER